MLGSYAHAEREAGGSALILTGDRDMFQCVSADCTVLYLTTGSQGGAVPVDEREVRRRYGVPPALVPDFIALRGDPSDGIPGAPRDRARRPPPTCSSAMARSRARSRSRPPSARAWPPRCERRRRAARFREIATLRSVDVDSPPDRPTDIAGGAQAVRELGMNRLAERLETQAAAGA